MKVVIAGGTGFLGKELTQHFLNQQKEVIILTRGRSRVENDVKFVHWDARAFGEWCGAMENCDVLINLSGKSVDCRYTEKNKHEIIASRVNSTMVLSEFISLMDNPPKIWMNASTATIYRDSLDKRMDEENGEIGDDFSMTVAKKWEKAFFESEHQKTRKIALRTSLVLGKNEGVYPVLRNLTKFRLAGKMGNGQQKFAWLHINDFLSIVDFVISKKSIYGPINCTSEQTITNKQFMTALRKSLQIKIGLPQPRWLLKIGAWFLRTESELILKSRWVYPKRLIDNGFQFNYPEISFALKDIDDNQS